MGLIVKRGIPTAAVSLLLAACGGGGDSEATATQPPPPPPSGGADTTAPTVSLSAPAPSTTVSGSVAVSANAADNVGVSGVQFQLDGANIGSEDTSSPYSATWNSTGTADGMHSLTAIARDAAGNVTTSSPVTVTVNNVPAPPPPPPPPPPDTTPPTVSVTAPANSATVSASITVSANASDDTGVVGVQFRIDNSALGSEDLTAPYSVSWDSTGVANGTHMLRAVARDAAGNQTTSSVVNITVNNAPPPNGAAINVGQIEVDPPTLITLGVSLPITSGDTNHNASVAMAYRKAGDSTWLQALPLLRVRPELQSQEDPTPFVIAQQFAGSIFDLQPDTEYEIQLTVTDPDGGDTTRTVTARTRPEPLANPTTPRAVNVSTLSALNTALSNAQPGDVITLADGTYNGAITVSKNGTATNPIIIRGTSRDGTIINATGATYGVRVTGEYVTVEKLTIQGSSWGMGLAGPRNLVARGLHIRNVSYGVEARSGSKRDFYICDNLIEGKVQWPKVDDSVWDFEGIVVTGAGHVVCYNTMSGFGDALGIHHDTSIPNRAIDFYGNDVLWTGDNGIELDFTERNVRAFRNRITNGGNQSISFQPVYGGPAYAIRNVIYNSAVSPFKFNNEPTGMIVLHNTAVRAGGAWGQFGARADDFVVENNLIIGTSSPVVDFTTSLTLATIDYNGYRPDGSFRFGSGSWSSFANLQANSPYEHNGRVLTALPFATALTIPAAYTTFVAPLDPALSATTNAIDGGLALPNINDGFAGANPDLGALERGATAPHYGVR